VCIYLCAKKSKVCTGENRMNKNIVRDPEEENVEEDVDEEYEIDWKDVVDEGVL